ncbi:MAG: BlaI/MecI/CopY family transcriptional regulator [Myxococcota bacterium]
MGKKKLDSLSRREKQVMDIVYRRGEASAHDVAEDLPDDPSYSAVRGMLRVLQEKGLLKHRRDGARYVYAPVVSRARALQSQFKNLLDTFFKDSPESVVATLLELRGSELSDDQLESMQAMIEKAKEEGR